MPTFFMVVHNTYNILYIDVLGSYIYEQ